MKHLLVIVMAFMTISCASTEQRTRTALDVMGKAIDPAYEAAVTVCKARAEQLTAKMQADFKPAYGEEVAKLTARCDKTNEAFTVIRQLHAQAVSALIGGAFDKARELYQQAIDVWAAMKGGS